MSAPTEEELMESMTWLDFIMIIGSILMWPTLILMIIFQ